MKRLSMACALALFVCALAPAQFQFALNAGFAGGNGQSGNMFEIVAINDVTICDFDIHLGTTNPNTIEVYALTATGTFAGNESNPAAWTLLATANVVGAGIGNPTPLNLNLGYGIPAGTTQAFYVTCTTSTDIDYTNGNAQGNVWAQDANIQFLEGTGNAYPFGTFFTPRVFNGIIYYEPGLGAGCNLPPAPSEWQVSQAGAGLTISGLPDPGPFAPLTKTAAVNSPETIDLSSDQVGNPWDLAILLPGAAQGFSALGLNYGSQTINVDISAPGLVFLNGGVGPNLTSSAFPAPTLSLPFALPTPVMGCGQMVVVNPAAPGGLSLSRAATYDAQVCNASDNFDALSLGTGVAPVAWQNGVSGAAWTVDTGGTPSSGTGPTVADTGANYMYCETSGSGGTATFVLDTCNADATALSTFTLDFALSRIGASIGTLNVYMDDGTGTFATLLMSYTGADPSQAQGGTEWSQESLPFVPTGAVVAFRFEYIAGGTFTGDLAIDSVAVN